MAKGLNLSLPVDKKDTKTIVGLSMGADMLNSVTNGVLEGIKIGNGFEILGRKFDLETTKLENNFKLSTQAMETQKTLAEYQKDMVKYVADKKTEAGKHADNTKLAMHRLTEYYKTQRAQALALNKSFSARSPYYYGNVA
ncbi:MAG: hypothetical protein ABIE74_00605 [Pseudomonadota bacterium]